jgi:hypothetical protein
MTQKRESNYRFSFEQDVGYLELARPFLVQNYKTDAEALQKYKQKLTRAMVLLALAGNTAP